MPRSSAQVHRNEPLTNVAVMFTPPELKAERIFKRIHVTNESDDYPVFDRDLFDAPDDFRADGTESKPSDTGWKYVPYQCQEHALHDKITKRMRDNADNEAILEGIKTRVLKQKVMNNLEKAVFGAGGIIRSTANNSYSVNLDWTAPDTADPRSGIQAAIDAVELNCGLPANTLCASTDTLRYIMRIKAVKDEQRYVMDLTKSDIPEELYGLSVIPVGAQVNTAKKGQSKIPTGRLMADDVWIGYVDPSESLGMEMITYGALLYTEEYTDLWYEKNIRGDKLEFGFIYTPQLVAKECGALLQSVRTA